MEIIVVLVIIAILAAISLPALTGYINDAKEKTAIAEARTAHTAGQTIASELFGMGVIAQDIEAYLESTDANSVPAGAPNYTKKINDLSNANGQNYFNGSTVMLDTTNGTIIKYKYTATNKLIVEYKSGTISIYTPIT